MSRNSRWECSEADLPTITACLDELGVCFCFAPLMHPAMKQVAAVRKQLGIRTVFNLLGPLTNPASAPCQLLGVGLPELRNRLANKAFLRACQKFTASRMVAEYESAYHQVASRMEKVA